MIGQHLRLGAGVLAVFTALAALSACGPQKVSRMACPAGKVCLEYGNGSDPTTLDPQKMSLTSEAAIVRALSEGLYKDSANGDPVLGLAASAPEVSADGLTWTFKLRAAKWSDGEPVTARDFVFSYRRMLDPNTASDYAYLLYLLKNGQAVNAHKARPEDLGVEAPDDHTLVLRLEHPAPFLPQLLKHQSFYPVPEHTIRKWGDAWVQPGHYVGAGPYKLTASKLGDYVRVEKNAFYGDGYGAGGPCIDRIDFLPTSDVVSAERRVRRGEIDINDSIQSSKVRFLRQPDQIPRYVHTHVYLSTSYVIFDTRNPDLKKLAVRQALSMSIDRNFITDKLMRAGQAPTYSFVPPGMAGYVPDEQRPKPYWYPLNFQQRLAEAKRLLAAAGYTQQHPLKFELKAGNSTDTILLVQAMQSDWRSIGIDVGLRQEEPQIAFQDFKIRDFDVGLVSWIMDYDDPMTFLGLMKSDTGGQNYGDYNNPAYDALLNQADHEPDGAKRAIILARAEQMVVDDADVAPVYNGVNRNLVNPNVTGWTDNYGDIHPVGYLCMKPASPATESRTTPSKP